MVYVISVLKIERSNNRTTEFDRICGRFQRFSLCSQKFGCSKFRTAVSTGGDAWSGQGAIKFQLS